MPRAGHTQSPQTRERIRRGVLRHNAVVREQERLVPTLAAFRRRPGVERVQRRLLDLAASEVLAIVEALGGVEMLSPQKLRLIEDCAIAGLILRRELGEYLERRDVEAASRVATLINSRRSSFAQIGLEAMKADPLDVAGYDAALRAAAAAETEKARGEGEAS